MFGGIESDQPCVIMFKKQENEWQISLADPTQKLDEINLKLTGNFAGENAFTENGQITLKVELPKNELAGKTVTLSLSKK